MPFNLIQLEFIEAVYVVCALQGNVKQHVKLYSSTSKDGIYCLP